VHGQDDTAGSASERSLGAIDEPTMLRWAAALGAMLQPGDVVLLRGPLGAGKTTFTRGLARGLGVDPAEVRSPTYTVCMRHMPVTPTGVELVHLDLYRMDDDGVESPAFSALGLEHDELPPPGAVLVVEWSERWRDPPSDTLMLVLERDHDAPARRVVRAIASGKRSLARLEAWDERGAAEFSASTQA
jgi:tRNA threonylcarbamoyl adenosine modification protein YjeE